MDPDDDLTDLGRLLSDNERLRGDVENLRRTIERRSTEIAFLIRERDTARELNDALRTENETLRRLLLADDVANNDLRQEVARLRQENEQFEECWNECERLKAQIPT